MNVILFQLMAFELLEDEPVGTSHNRRKHRLKANGSDGNINPEDLEGQRRGSL